jgi:hypothetical protein
MERADYDPFTSVIELPQWLPPMAALARRSKSRNCLTRTVPVTKAAFLAFYRDYIACLNRQEWPNLARFVQR